MLKSVLKFAFFWLLLAFGAFPAEAAGWQKNAPVQGTIVSSMRVLSNTARCGFAIKADGSVVAMFADTGQKLMLVWQAPTPQAPLKLMNEQKVGHYPVSYFEHRCGRPQI